jgi:hypothetical protein
VRSLARVDTDLVDIMQSEISRVYVWMAGALVAVSLGLVALAVYIVVVSDSTPRNQAQADCSRWLTGC